MGEEKKKFIVESERKSFDIKHRSTIRFNMSKYEQAFEKGLSQFTDLEAIKQKVANIKRTALQDWDVYLEQFEQQITQNGAQVLWASDAQEALSHIDAIMQKHHAKMVVKSKSMTTEEIELNAHLEHQQIEVVETDLGEYIVQVAGEKPYHIVTPAMHKSKEDVAELFNQHFNTPIESTPQELTQFVREKLRDKFTHADVGITGGNFLVADIGAVALTENEGNGLMTTAFPKVHVAIVGIEKIIPSFKDLNYIWPTLAAHGTGQNITSYSSLFRGPKQEGETDGPESMYVILLDNGRSQLFTKPEQSRALACIRCGACLNVCPVYRNIGGYTYNSTYSGPIGSVITPHYNGFGVFQHLSFASTLCGKCTEVCPVKIDLHDLLLLNRQEAVQNNSDWVWDIAMKGYQGMMQNRFWMDAVPGNVMNVGIKTVLKGKWGKYKLFPKFSRQSFSQQYKKAEKIKHNNNDGRRI
ncbi:MAG: lactate utilization protein [Bacteroidales bacterium]|nr:lactate utilization protein [Bacteroidales bacterium]